MAQLHRSEASRLHAELDQACGDAVHPRISWTSPLLLHAVGGMPTEAGVVLFVAPSAGTPAQLEKLVQCHRAFLRVHGSSDDRSPLALPGLHVLVRGDPSGLALELTVDDPTLVGELQRRAANQLELARRYSATHH